MQQALTQQSQAEGETRWKTAWPWIIGSLAVILLAGILSFALGDSEEEETTNAPTESGTQTGQ